MKIVKFLEKPDLLMKRISQTIENIAKERKGGFLGMLVGTLGANLLGNLLAGKGVYRDGEGAIRAGQDF